MYQTKLLRDILLFDFNNTRKVEIVEGSDLTYHLNTIRPRHILSEKRGVVAKILKTKQ